MTGIHAYCSTKHAVVGLTRQLAQELGPFNITVNSVAPGFMRTNEATEKQWDSYGPEGQRDLMRRIAMQRLGRPDDIANAVIFFASDLAGFVNGQIQPDRRRAIAIAHYSHDRFAIYAGLVYGAEKTSRIENEPNRGRNAK